MPGKSINHKRVWRQVHYWGALICALPVLVIIVTGLLLLLKKELDWVQPPTYKTDSYVPTISFQKILQAAQETPQTNVNSFSDIDRIDVSPKKGVIKVRANNGWEIQLHPQTAAVLHAAYRRSEWMEALHDGSWFHDKAKLGIFLPASVVLLVLWLTGIFLFLVTLAARQKKRLRNRTSRLETNNSTAPWETSQGHRHQQAL